MWCEMALADSDLDSEYTEGWPMICLPAFEILERRSRSLCW